MLKNCLPSSKRLPIRSQALCPIQPSARGLGLGQRLVDECIAFARKAGYKKITLWTQSSLVAARHIYESTGFVLSTTLPALVPGVTVPLVPLRLMNSNAPPSRVIVGTVAPSRLLSA